MSFVIRTSIALVGICIACAAPPALAVAQRTFVASYGSDTNPCSIALPCRSFDTAIGATSSGGEVVVKDSAGYGTATIGQSVSIIAPAGVYAGITTPGLGTGVIVNAPGAKVLLRGLTINGQTTALYGIWLQNGAELVIDRCALGNNKTAGVYVTAPGSTLTVTDTLIRYTLAGQGVRLNSDVRAVFDRVRVLRSIAGIGLWADAGANVTIKDSLLASNFGGGVLVSGGAAATGSVTGSTITRHTSGQGVTVNSNPPATASVSATANLVTQNGNGMGTAGTGQLLSARDNTFSRNTQFAFAAGVSPIHTVKGADGLPSNAGEQATATSGTITPVNPF